MSAIKQIKLVIIEKICTHYRIPIFERLSRFDNIDLILYYGQAKKTKYKKYCGVENIKEFKNRKLFTLSLFFKLKDRLFPVFFNPTILFYLNKDKPDVIITEGESNLLNNLSILIYTKLTKTPYIWMSLGRVPGQRQSIFRTILAPLISYMLKNAAAILSYSNFGKDFYTSVYGIKKEKIFVFYNCIDTDKVFKDIKKYKPLVNQEKKKLGVNNKKIILFVGSFEKTKKIDNLILAYQQIKNQYPDTALMLVGDGEERINLEQMVEKRGIDDVIFTGRKIEEATLYFLMGDVFVLPGLGGLAINQAMTCGKPIITVPADGTEKDMVINNKNGYIVESDNVSALAEAISKILRDEKLRKRMGQYSQMLVKKYFNVNNALNIISQAINFSIKNK